MAAHTLRPGDHVGFHDDGRVGYCDKPLGIVDPFLTVIVQPGQRFYLIVYPRTITSLRHVWEHPAFTDASVPVQTGSKAASEAWLRDFCDNNDCPNYEMVIGRIKESPEGPWSDWDATYFHFDGTDAHAEIPGEFWDHVERVLDIKVSNRPTWFSCSC